MEGINFIDTEGADALMSLAQVGLDANIDVRLSRVKPQVIEVLERDGFFDLVGRDHVHDNIADAVEQHLASSSPTPSKVGWVPR